MQNKYKDTSSNQVIILQLYLKVTKIDLKIIMITNNQLVCQVEKIELVPE
jgi:hypothetical protein